MESSRRAVEAYRRTRLIDAVTADDDKVAPVYKLDEISSVVLSSPSDVVHEMVDYIFKRVEHKSPLVKQKTLRLIKFTVGKSGSEYKKEIQRQSAAIRQLFHYQGQPDSLRGDSLNKAVRETSREAITALFASDEKPPSLEETRKRIEGFGSTNFDPRPLQEKKTLLSEVVDLGAASIKQGLTMISNHYGGHFGGSNGMSKSSTGSYEAPNLRRSVSDRDNYKYRDSYRDSYSDSRDSYRDTYTGAYESKTSYDMRETEPDSPKSDGEEETNDAPQGITHEEKLLDTVTPLGGVRIQPSRESIQSFLLTAQKLNPQRLHQAFEQKLQSHSWQVRLKTLCFLEATLRQSSLKPFGDISHLFEANNASIVECSESPQSSLREKAIRVLAMLRTSNEGSQGAEDRTSRQAKGTENTEMPDLIDTRDDLSPRTNDLDVLSSLADTSPIQEDLLGDGVFTESAQDNKASSLFEGLSIADEPSTKPLPATGLSDLLGSLDTNSSAGTTGTLHQQSDVHQSFFPGLMGLEQLQPGFSRPQASFVSPLSSSSGSGFAGSAEFMMSNFNNARKLAPPQAFPGASLGRAAMQQPFQPQQFSGGFGMPFVAQGASFGNEGFDFSSHPYATASASLPKMEETTKAFDFITDHVSAARTMKK